MVLPKILYKEQFGLTRAPATKRANSLTENQILPNKITDSYSTKEDYLKRPVKFAFEAQLKPSFSQLIASPPKKALNGPSLVPQSNNFLITFNTGTRSTDQTSSDSRAEIRDLASPQPCKQSRKHQKLDVFSSLDCLEVNPFYPEAMQGEVFRTGNPPNAGRGETKENLTKQIDVGLPRLSSHFPKLAETTHKQYRSNLRKVFANQQNSFNLDTMQVQKKCLNSPNSTDIMDHHSPQPVPKVHNEHPRVLQQRVPTVVVRPEKVCADWAVSVGPASQLPLHLSERRERLLPVFRLKQPDNFGRWSGRQPGRRFPGLESRSCDDAGDLFPQPA